MSARTLKIICLAVVLSNGFYYRLVFSSGVSWQKLAGPALARFTPICSGLAAIALVVAALIALKKLRIRSEATEVITALILAESATAIFGLLLIFMGLPPEKFLRFLGATLFVQLVCITPRVFKKTEKERKKDEYSEKI